MDLNTVCQNDSTPDRRRQPTTGDGSALVEGGDAGGGARASGWDGRFAVRTNYVGSLVVVVTACVVALVVGVLGFRLWARMGGFLKGESPEPGSDS
jgi:hypothetical protein